MFCFNKRLFITFGKLHFKHSPSTRSKRHTQLHYALFTNYKSKTKNKILFICCSWPKCGSGTSVGIGTRYWLDGGGIESQWEARISAPVQTGPGAHPASCKMGTRSFPGVKCGRGVLLTTHSFLASTSWKSRVLPAYQVQVLIWTGDSGSYPERTHGDKFLDCQ